MSPPRIVFGEHLDIVVFIEFVGRQDRDRGTSGGSIRERGRSPLDGTQRSTPGRDHRAGPLPVGDTRAVPTPSGLIVLRPGFDGMGAEKSGERRAGLELPHSIVSKGYRTDVEPVIRASE